MCEDYKTVKEVVCDLILISTHQYTGNDEKGCSTICSDSINRLKALLYGKKVAIEDGTALDDKNKKSIPGSILVNETDEDEPIYWFNNIIDRNELILTLESNGDQVNPYYLPKFVDVLKRLISRLPLYSNVMCRFFNSNNFTPSSSNCESAFNIIKNFLLK